jgi:hypothetical protein
VKARGASLKATEQPIDTGTAAGKCFLDMLGVFAEFETNLRRERQLEGIAKAKAEGVYKGRPASIDAAQVREMKSQGLGSHGDSQGPQDRPRVGLSGIGGGAVDSSGAIKAGVDWKTPKRRPLFSHLADFLLPKFQPISMICVKIRRPSGNNATVEEAPCLMLNFGKGYHCRAI